MPGPGNQRGGVGGARKGSNLSSGRSCSTSDSQASSSSTFSTSRGTGAPAAPHTVEAPRENSARLWVRPQTPGPARTLKLSSRRHRLPARPPTAPLLSGLRGAQAQCNRPRDSAHSEHARACGPVGKGAGASAHEARSSSAAPPPPAEDFERTALKQQFAFTPRRLRDQGTPPAGGCSRCQLCGAAASRHGADARRRLRFQRSIIEKSPQPHPPRDRPLWRFHFLNWTAGHALGKHRPEFLQSVGKSCLSIS